MDLDDFKISPLSFFVLQSLNNILSVIGSADRTFKKLPKNETELKEREMKKVSWALVILMCASTLSSTAYAMPKNGLFPLPHKKRLKPQAEAEVNNDSPETKQIPSEVWDQ